jgi:hypothetical protein
MAAQEGCQKDGPVSIPLAQHQLSKSSVGLLGWISERASRGVLVYGWSGRIVEAGAPRSGRGVLRPRRILRLPPRGASGSPRGAGHSPRIGGARLAGSETRLAGREACPAGRKRSDPGRTARPGSVGLAFRRGRPASRIRRLASRGEGLSEPQPNDPPWGPRTGLPGRSRRRFRPCPAERDAGTRP